MPIRIPIRISILMRIQIRIRIGIKPMWIHMRIPVHMLENREKKNYFYSQQCQFSIFSCLLSGNANVLYF